MILSVPNMTCGHCKAKVEAAIQEVGGKAVVSLEDHEVEVNGLPGAVFTLDGAPVALLCPTASDDGLTRLMWVMNAEKLADFA